MIIIVLITILSYFYHDLHIKVNEKENDFSTRSHTYPLPLKKLSIIIKYRLNNSVYMCKLHANFVTSIHVYSTAEYTCLRALEELILVQCLCCVQSRKTLANSKTLFKLTKIAVIKINYIHCTVPNNIKSIHWF